MRRLLALVTTWLVLLNGAVGVAAQDATPMTETAVRDALFADTMGLPEIRITETDTAFEGVPAELPAGRYLVTIVNNTSQGDAIAEFNGLPGDFTYEDFLASVGLPAPGATPDPASPPAFSEVPPDEFYEAYLPGGPAAQFPGQTAQGIVDLQPGEYAVADLNPDNPQGQVIAAPLTVTGGEASPEAMAEPAADVTIREVKAGDGYAFELEGTLAPGPQAVKVVNDSDQPHFFILIKSPGPITRDQALALLTLDPSTGATPPPGAPNPEEFVEVSGTGTQSAGTTQWIATNLEPGYYVIVCFVQDPTKDYIPHAFEGMVDVYTVGDVGTPTP